MTYYDDDDNHTWLSAVKQVRMITAFPELHQNVEQPHLIRLAGTIHNVNVLHQNLCIPINSNIHQLNAITIKIPGLIPQSKDNGIQDSRTAIDNYIVTTIE